MLNEFTGFETQSRLVRIPVCYDDEFAIDMPWIAEQKNLTREEISPSAQLEAISCLYAWIFAGLPRIWGEVG
jgi:hypothetical protein